MSESRQPASGHIPTPQPPTPNLTERKCKGLSTVSEVTVVTVTVYVITGRTETTGKIRNCRNYGEMMISVSFTAKITGTVIP